MSRTKEDKASMPPKTTGQILSEASKRALGGGLPGAAAMGVNVCTLMPLRTTMNYQYRHGTTTGEAIRSLYSEGRIRRFYRGVGPALIQGPMSRFGDCFFNSGMFALLNSYETSSALPIAVKTFAASTCAAGFRIFLMPVDALKTSLQVEGARGLALLKNKITIGGVRVLYHGALAAYSANLVGNFPWFFTNNTLEEWIPKRDKPLEKLGRHAFIGFASSVVSDTCSNSIRVIKTTKQTYHEPISYSRAITIVKNADGWIGLLGRGLKTRILANGLQGLLFNVMWRHMEQKFNARMDARAKS